MAVVLFIGCFAIVVGLIAFALLPSRRNFERDLETIERVKFSRFTDGVGTLPDYDLSQQHNDLASHLIGGVRGLYRTDRALRAILSVTHLLENECVSGSELEVVIVDIRSKVRAARGEVLAVGVELLFCRLFPTPMFHAQSFAKQCSAIALRTDLACTVSKSKRAPQIESVL